MTNQRSRITLDEAEQRSLLQTARTLQIASIGPDGRPHLVPMWFALDEDGLIVFTTYGSSQKVRNLERDPRITVLVETGDAYNELRGVAIDGTAEVVRDARVTWYTGARIGEKYRGVPWSTTIDASAEPPPTKRVTIRVHPERARSWDHRKIG